MCYKSTIYEKVILYLYVNEAWKIYTGLIANKIKFFFLLSIYDFIIYNYANIAAKSMITKIEYCFRLLYQPVFDTNVTTSM